MVVIASECTAPPATTVQEYPPTTAVGTDWLTAELVPSCPPVPWPHAYSTPAVVMAREKSPPAEITDHDAPAGPETNTGLDTVVRELLPTCPDVLRPHP